MWRVAQVSGQWVPKHRTGYRKVPTTIHCKPVTCRARLYVFVCVVLTESDGCYGGRGERQLPRADRSVHVKVRQYHWWRSDHAESRLPDADVCFHALCTSVRNVPSKHAVSKIVRIDPLHFLAGCRKRRLNRAPYIIVLV